MYAFLQLVVLRGVGEKAFCAGGDIKALHDNGIDPEKRHAAYSFFRCARMPIWCDGCQVQSKSFEL